MLPDNRVVPLQYVEVIRVPPMPFAVRGIDARRLAVTVSIPVREPGTPTIGHRDEMSILLDVGRQDSGFSGVT